MNVTNILNENLYSDRIKDNVLIVGTCIPVVQKEVFANFMKDWDSVFSICLEQDHYNKLMAKLSDLLGTGRVKKMGFLTVDGSPHCVQVHYASKYLKRNLKVNVEYEHYVVDKNGQVYEVSMEAIDESRNLSKVGKKYVQD
ncbi:hypothetical protein GF389_04775 [Candidatus Dojkabacteria bacterium]|nr:hypothetical protein [Candidatus Dojkabacteria bacterium]